MGICTEEFRQYVVRPTLEQLGHQSLAAENLLVGTAAKESGLGFHLTNRHTHGLGIYQIRPRIHRSIWDNFLVGHPALASKIRGLASQHEFLSHPHAELATNLSYATAIAWMIYYRHGKELPQANDVDALARYWQRYYQRPHGLKKRSLYDHSDFISSYRQHQPQVSAA